MYLSKVIIFSLLLINFPVSYSVLQGYNESCELYDETSTCDDTIGLMCIDSGIKGYRCKCPSDNQFGTIYDPQRNRCVGKVFNSCVRGSSCAMAVKYGQSCDNDKAQCDSKYGLSCQSDGNCGCKDISNQFYDSREEKCITYVGGNCSLEENLCVPNAVCSATTSTTSKIPKFPMANPNSAPRRRTIIFGSEEANKNSEISFSTLGTRKGSRDPPTRYSGSGGINTSGTSILAEDTLAKCVCKSGFSQTKDGFCMKSYGSICTKMMERNSTEICNPDQYLECLDAYDGHFRCQCRNLLNERWDESKNQCVSLIGRKCRPSPSYPKCDAGGECVNDICQCKKGTSLTPSGGCKLDYNERCDTGDCNVYAGLTCHGKTASCLCLDSYLKYDIKKKACLASIGSPCGSVDLIGFPAGNNFPNRFSNSAIRNDNNNSEAIPFIGCEEGAVCSPKVVGKRMSYTCVVNRS